MLSRIAAQDLHFRLGISVSMSVAIPRQSALASTGELELVNVKVKYKYASAGREPSVSTQETVMVEGKTESAVMAHLRRKYPNREIIISIE